jgi:hypothetical protein
MRAQLITLGLLFSSACIVPETVPEQKVEPRLEPVGGSADGVAVIPAARVEEIEAKEDLPAGVREKTAPTLSDARATHTRVSRSRPTIAPEPSRAWMHTEKLFGSTELGPVEANVPAKGMAHFYGTPRDATMHLRVSGLKPGEYGAYIGKDCKSAASLHDTNPFDTTGVGSGTLRPGEIKVGVVAVDGRGEGELDARVPWAYADLPPLDQRALILMPASAEKVDQPQTKVACGLIESVRDEG